MEAGRGGLHLLSLHFGRPRQVDHLRSRVHDQPGQHDKTPSLLKIQKLARRGVINYMYRPNFSETDALINGTNPKKIHLQEIDSHYLFLHHHIFPLFSLLDLMIYSLHTYRSDPFKRLPLLRIKFSPEWQLTPVIPAPWEAEVDTSLEARSSRPAWPTWN
ncbi:hypothetical protein AAY473_005362 [Plecturocebus cupreus]